MMLAVRSVFVRGFLLAVDGKVIQLETTVGSSTAVPDGPAAEAARPAGSAARAAATSGYQLKRLLDLVLGVPLAVLTTPVMAVLLLTSAVHFRAWPLFVQSRDGKAGRRNADSHLVVADEAGRCGNEVRRPGCNAS